MKQREERHWDGSMPEACADAAGVAGGTAGLDAPILVLDSNLALLASIARLLGDLGYRRVKTSNNVSQAADLMARNRAEVLLLGCDGQAGDAISVLTEFEPLLRAEQFGVILLARGASPQQLYRALRLGAADYISLPDGLAELGLRLKSLLVARWRRERLLLHDGMTGLPNRLGVRRHLDEMLSRATSDDQRCAVIHVDLDRFRNFNDSYGHAAGDLLLREAAARIVRGAANLGPATAMPGGAAAHGVRVGRVTGNGFAILVNGLERELALQHAAELAQRIHELFTEPMEVAGRRLFQTVSSGIALHPQDGKDADTLLAAAEQAMYQAKRGGRNGYEFHSAPLSAPKAHRMMFETDIHRVLERDELRVYYQPRVEIGTGNILGVEALLRWEHPEHGLISPGLFIPMAEELGLIADIGRWVMERACTQARLWKEQRLGVLDVSVNVSSPQLRNQRLWRDVRDVLRATALAPNQLVLELTESMIMDDAEDNVRMLQELKELGVQCSIDDFGTGYSSLAYLTRFPLDEIKIDRSFVKPLAQDRQSQAIVNAIIALARELGVHAVAEGVETREQLSVLRARGCHQFQGYLCSRPLPADDMTAFLRACRVEAEAPLQSQEKPAWSSRRNTASVK